MRRILWRFVSLFPAFLAILFSMGTSRATSAEDADPAAKAKKPLHVRARKTDLGVTITLDEKPFTEYLIKSGTKPILWPILGPTGKPMTRAFPMDESGKGTVDHPHHRSLWFMHGEVNDMDFWLETPSAKAGTVVHREYLRVASGEKSAVVSTKNDWLSPSGKKVCEDARTMTFGGDETARWIDFDITIRATEGPLHFGDTKEGTFGLRVADSMRVDAKTGAQIINSQGLTDAKAWGKPAAWVDYHGPIDGKTLGIAMMNHPSSFHYPTRWHVRTYGLFAANPFGVDSFVETKKEKKENKATKSEPTGYTLPQGESLRLRYRILLHQGDEKIGRVSESFAEYAGRNLPVKKKTTVP